MSKRIKIFDTTLRDGEQSPGCSMNLKEKVELALQLERLGVDVIEAGFAVSSPGDFEAVHTIAGAVKNCTVASLVRSIEKDIDVSWNAVKHAESPRLHVFLATSPIHMKYKLKKEPEAVLEQAVAAVKYAAKLCGDVEFSAEDASRSDMDFLARVAEAVINAGATVVNLPDTVGYASPEEMYNIMRYMRDNVQNIDKAELSCHVHNDIGLAVANSLAAIKGGAEQVECTVNGIGERAGNASLEEIVMALKTRKDFYDCVTNIDTKQIYRTSKLLSSITGVKVQPNKAIVGANAFAHESGIHQHGVLNERTTYEVMNPKDIGIPESKMVLGKHSGRHALEDRIKELGYDVTIEQLNQVFEQFKALADKKKVVLDEDIETLIKYGTTDVPEVYKCESFVVSTGNNISALAAVKLCRNGECVELSSLGDGPIDATFKAIGSITDNEYTLEDFSIRAVTEGQDALGEVVVKVRRGDRIITGRAVSTDIIESSIKAYLNAINKILAM